MPYSYTLKKLHKVIVYSITSLCFRAAESFGLQMFQLSPSFPVVVVSHLSSVSGFYFFMAKSPVKLIENSPLVFHAAVCLNDSSKILPVMPALVILSKQRMLNWRCLFKRELTSCCFFNFSSLPQDQSGFIQSRFFQSHNINLFSQIAFFILRISFSSVFLSVFYCSCPILLQGEFLHANKTSFPTWQRFTHAINLSCVLWLMFRLPMEVSQQIR